MAFKHYISFSLAFLATTTILLAGNASAHHPAIADLCAHADYPALCKSMIKAKDDPKSATEMAINALVLKTAQAKSSAIKLRSQGSTPRKPNLDMCKDIYDDAIINLMTSKQNLKSGDKASLNINLSAALSDYVACHDSYIETPGVNDPLGKVNVLLGQMASNALELASEVH